MGEKLTPRQEMAAERLMEDEGLTGDLLDEQAAPLIRWATEAAVKVAAPEVSEEEEEAGLRAIAQAVRQVARSAGAERDPARLVALAEAALAALRPERRVRRVRGAPARFRAPRGRWG
ncbi:hypothetical protein EYB53_016885 [Candidatus Chloroploca sp. M-50]|uniref:Uncharacterized protein n=1 Tax=Candidatus Chloroploca mongolica TaxID=2528176 RepID=A0ABS4DD61_9CHLR|nr:hypothetical protein [Candidatus Chloroploca mongolica]MBP1467391.1 hypothetical protein [Candidatus Chloroploca mongolica]